MLLVLKGGGDAECNLVRRSIDDVTEFFHAIIVWGAPEVANADSSGFCVKRPYSKRTSEREDCNS